MTCVPTTLVSELHRDAPHIQVHVSAPQDEDVIDILAGRKSFLVADVPNSESESRIFKLTVHGHLRSLASGIDDDLLGFSGSSWLISSCPQEPVPPVTKIR